jgi:hypothetical protein
MGLVIIVFLEIKEVPPGAIYILKPTNHRVLFLIPVNLKIVMDIISWIMRATAPPHTYIILLLIIVLSIVVHWERPGG